MHPNIEIMISQFPKRVAQAILTIMHLAVFIFCAFLALKAMNSLGTEEHK